MAKAFSVASWNVEHMANRDERNQQRMNFLAAQQPDVIGIYEVEGSDVWREVMAAFPAYSFFITEGQNAQEILVGIGPRVTGFLTQRIEFQSRDAFMRPGALLTVRAGGENYSLLFLHLASMTDARGFGLRADMIDRALKFKGVLDEASGGNANFILLGDLNQMGLEFVHGKQGNSLQRVRVSADQELARLGYEASKIGMRVLQKSETVTWRSKTMRSDLDWVVASDQLRFKTFAGGAEVDVRGWPQLPEAEQLKWTKDFSDHALLYFEVQAP